MSTFDDRVEGRVRAVAEHVCRTRCTIRDAAEVFEVSRSTIHRDLVERLPAIDNGLYRQANEILQRNLNTRHLRGGRLRAVSIWSVVLGENLYRPR